jgi:ADP-heptose:LPS heptosyltransferase
MKIAMSFSERASACVRPGSHAMQEVDADGRAAVRTTRSARPDRRLLVILRALGLRDFLTAVPAFHALAEAFPDHRRILAAPAELAPLARLCGGIDGVVPINRLAPLPSDLHRADIAINLDRRAPASHRVLLDTNPGRLLAFAQRGVLGGNAGPRWIEGEPEAERWCRMLEGHGIGANPYRLEFRHPPAPRPDALGATLIEPGGLSPAWRWPVQHWVAIVRAERASGRRVLITGRSTDAAVALEIAYRAGLERQAICTGQVGVRELAELVAAAGRVICGDTAMAHLATAMNTPSVLLFGPTSSPESTPPVHRPWHRVLWEAPRPGLQDTHTHQGFLTIPVGRVLAALSDISVSTSVEHESREPLAAGVVL